MRLIDADIVELVIIELNERVAEYIPKHLEDKHITKYPEDKDDICEVFCAGYRAAIGSVIRLMNQMTGEGSGKDEITQ